MAKNTFYFSHDYNARNDIKIKKLLSKHGFIGYGIFWAIIEELYNNANALPTDYDTIAFDLRVDKSLLISVIKDFDLFVFNEDTFGSLSVQSRIEAMNEKSKKARDSASYRWKKVDSDANALPKQTDSNAIKDIKESKVNETNEIKDIVDNEKIRFDFFWNSYGKKVGDKVKLKRKWDNLPYKDQLSALEYIPKYIESQPDKQYRKNPETFINNKSWNDELIYKQPKEQQFLNKTESLKSEYQLAMDKITGNNN